MGQTCIKGPIELAFLPSSDVNSFKMVTSAAVKVNLLLLLPKLYRLALIRTIISHAKTWPNGICMRTHDAAA